MPPTMSGPCGYVLGWALLIRGEGFVDWLGDLCLILDNTTSIASIIPDDSDDVMLAGDAGDVAKSGQFCRKRAT